MDCGYPDGNDAVGASYVVSIAKALFQKKKCGSVTRGNAHLPQLSSCGRVEIRVPESSLEEGRSLYVLANTKEEFSAL
jgi:hypothetical protein